MTILPAIGLGKLEQLPGCFQAKLRQLPGTKDSLPRRPREVTDPNLLDPDTFPIRGHGHQDRRSECVGRNGSKNPIQQIFSDQLKWDVDIGNANGEKKPNTKAYDSRQDESVQWVFSIQPAAQE